MKRWQWFVIVCVLLGITGCCSQGTIYKTPYIEADLMNRYTSNLSKWPVPYKSQYVGTTYGSTHVIISGPADGPSLFLFHAMGVMSTMWLPNIEALSTKYRVYCVDYIGDFGRSHLHRFKSYPKNGKMCSEWVIELMDQLGVEHADVIGASYGGWVALNVALHHPERVKKLGLLGPMGIAPVTKEVVKRLISLVLFPSDEKKQAMVDWTLGTDPQVREQFAELMWVAMESKNKIAMPFELKDDELGQIQAPILLCLGENDGPIGPPAIPAERAKQFLMNVQVEILPETGHLMNVEQSGWVNARLIEFFTGSSSR